MMGLSLCGDSAQLHIPPHNPTIVTTPCTVLYCTVLYCTVLYCSQSYHCHSTAPPLILSWTGHPRYNWPTLLTPILLLSWPKICANKSVIHKNDIACLHLKSPALACNSSQFIAKKVMAPHRAAVKHGVRGNTKGCLALRVTRDTRDTWWWAERRLVSHRRICASLSGRDAALNVPFLCPMWTIGEMLHRWKLNVNS